MIQTPLHIAASQNRVEIMKYLLEWTGPWKVELEAKNIVRYNQTEPNQTKPNCFLPVLKFSDYRLRFRLIIVHCSTASPLCTRQLRTDAMTPFACSFSTGPTSKPEPMCTIDFYYVFNQLHIVYIFNYWILLTRFVGIMSQNSMTPLHLAVGYALRTGDNSVVNTLSEYNADFLAQDDVRVHIYIESLIRIEISSDTRIMNRSRPMTLVCRLYCTIC